MKPSLTSSSTGTAVEARVLTWAALRAQPEQLAQFRKQPGATRVAPIAPAQLKHSEDQTVAAVWAFCEALAGLELDAPPFTRWGVVAATRFCGRSANAQSLDRYRHEGAWGISPHMIPHHSLHAVSGTLSQIFKIHGPNFGIGNGLDSSSEGWLVAASLLSENLLPGLWLVITGHEGEFLPERPGRSHVHPACEAVALALVNGGDPTTGLQVRIGVEESSVPEQTDDGFLGALPAFSLTGLIDELTRRDTPPGAMWRLPGTGWLEVEMR